MTTETPTIPPMEEVLNKHKAGEIDTDQALQWIGSLIDSAVSREMMRDHFASAAMVPEEEGWQHLRVALAPEDPIAGLESSKKIALDVLTRRADMEARLRYIKADAMLRARIL